MPLLRIGWKNRKLGVHTDFLELDRLIPGVAQTKLAHKIEPPSGAPYSAVASIDVQGNIVLLSYQKTENPDNDVFTGTTRIVFKDIVSHTVDRIEWANEEEGFEDLSPDFDLIFDAADSEVRRRSRFGEIIWRSQQAIFSREVRSVYESGCAVTDCKTQEALEAAHIRMIEGGDVNDLTNGILLRADIHALFDAGLIALTADGSGVQLLKTFKDPAYQFLKTVQVRRPRGCAPSHENIMHHRKRFQFE